jgi:hypothetical protein
MICAPCKNQRHDECPTVDRFPPHPAPFVPAKDKTWCDCGHRTVDTNLRTNQDPEGNEVTHYVFANLATPSPTVLDEQFAYVDGYILALEDLLKNLNDLQAREGTPGANDLLLEQRVARNGAYGSVRAIVNRSLANARDTMAMLKTAPRAAEQLIEPMQPIVFDPAKGGVQYPAPTEEPEPQCTCKPPFPEHQWECPANR